MQVLIPHSHDAELEDFEIFSGHLAVMKRINGLSMISTFTLGPPGPSSGLVGIASQEPKLIEFDEESYSLQFGEQGAFGSSMLRITYSSLVTPDSTFDVNMTTGKLFVLTADAVSLKFYKPGFVSYLCHSLQHGKQAKASPQRYTAHTIASIMVQRDSLSAQLRSSLMGAGR